MLDFVLGVILLQVSGMRTTENTGTKVVVRTTTAWNVTEVTTYTMGDRRRTESRHSVQWQNADGSPGGVEKLGNVMIFRCDLGQSFTLNMKTEEYTSAAYPPKRLTAEELAARGAKMPDASQAMQPTLRLETTTVDTGERKEFFGRMARHVIITTKQTPLEGSHAQAQETVSDGWYIDFDRRLSCEPKPTEAGVKGGYLAVGVLGPGQKLPVERPEFVDIGPKENGFPVKLVRTSPGTMTLPDGTSEAVKSTAESEVIQFEEGPIDPALFEIPPGFKRIERTRREPE
jgi:hypothetical protein